MRFSVNDFYKEQLYEIRKGIKQGLDVKLYANPVYNEFQMRELRLGLLNKVKINYFADPDFDCLQMQEIRLGMQNGINIREYAKTKISSFKMRKIREKLEIESETICDNKYCRRDFDAFQWCVMKYGVSEGIDITAFAKPELSCGEMLDILHGLEETVKLA